MSRSEDPVIVRAELSALDQDVLIGLIVPLVIDLRHATNTVPGFLSYIRQPIGSGAIGMEMIRSIDALDLLE